MAVRHGLGDLEFVVLLAVLRLGDSAYGAAVRAEIRARTGRTITPGAIYPTLDRLEAKGLVRSHVGDPTPEPGGRARRLFALCPAGRRELRRMWRQYRTLVQGIEPLLDPGS